MRTGSFAEKGMLATGALIGAAGIGMQFYFMMQVPGISRAEAVVRFFSFFTILTNLLVTVGYLAPLLAPGTAVGRVMARAAVRGGTLVYIVVVGVVYNLLLRQLYHPKGWAKAADVLVHDAAPVFYLLYWLLFARKAGLRAAHAGKWLLYPLAYLIYTMLRGAVVGYYPYPFVDVAVLGYARVLMNAAGLTAVFWMLGLMVVAAARGAAD
jgi:hypothetical protein